MTMHVILSTSNGLAWNDTPFYMSSERLSIRIALSLHMSRPRPQGGVNIESHSSTTA